MIVKRFGAALALSALLAPFACVAALAADFQVPPRPTTEVVDAADALSPSARTALETKLEAFESATGRHVVVYIGQTTGNVPLETWTAQTAQTWHVGQKGKDDGAVLFLFMKDHKVRIEVGYGLEGTLTDASANQIITNAIIPKMKAGDTDGAVTAGVNGILSAIDPSYSSGGAQANDSDGHVATASPANPLVFLGVVLFVLIVAFFIFMQIYTAFWYGHLIRREGKEAADKDLRKSWLHIFMLAGASAVAGSSGGGFYGGGGGGFSGGGGGGFSGGSFGGSFGGGGSSGSW